MPSTGIPSHDRATMETDVERVFIAGVLASGNDANKVFIENGRGHGALIARRLVAPRRSRYDEPLARCAVQVTQASPHGPSQ